MEISRLFYLIILSIVIIPGCSKKSYYQNKLFHSFSSKSDYSSIDRDVTLKVKKLTTKDCVSLFEERGDRLSNNKRNGLIPLYISIYNSSDESVIFDPRYITLHTEKRKQVIRFMQSDTVGNTIFNFIAGTMITATSAAAAALSTVWLCPPDPLVFVPATLAGGIVGALTATGTIIKCCVSGVNSARINSKMRKILRATVSETPVVIAPGTCHNALVFVRKPDFYHTFNISIQRDSDDDITFFVHLAS